MADVDLGPDGDPARLQRQADGVAGRHLHFQNHHGRRKNHRYSLTEMPDGLSGGTTRVRSALMPTLMMSRASMGSEPFIPGR